MNMSRKPIIAANWKMNKTRSESVSLASAITSLLGPYSAAEVVLCPPFVNIESVGRCLSDSILKIGAQNMHFDSAGAFTGEISPKMLKDIHCSYVILGHSERRSLFGESHHFINQKVKAALCHGLIPILCVGETITERENNQTFSVISEQLEKGLQEVLPLLQNRDIVLAYEPIWAIGTGKVATPEEAQEVHAFIRSQLALLLNQDYAPKIRIQYGGSVKSDNIATLLSQPDIDGALVGGASLEADSFVRLLKNVPIPATVFSGEPLRPTLF